MQMHLTDKKKGGDEKATSANTYPFLLMIFFWTVLRRQEELWAYFFTCFRSGEIFSKKYRKTLFSDYDCLDNMWESHQSSVTWKATQIFIIPWHDTNEIRFEVPNASSFIIVVSVSLFMWAVPILTVPGRCVQMRQSWLRRRMVRSAPVLGSRRVWWVESGLD